MGKNDQLTTCRRFRWASCQMQILEHIRDESQLIDSLNSLPSDLDEIYLRLLSAIPEPDRLFVRRVLLWIAGHSFAGRLRDKGIHLDVLVSAVCDDLQNLTGRTYRYTADDVRELCGCLITVTERPLPFTDFLRPLHMLPPLGGECKFYIKAGNDEDAPMGSFVSIAHYTVLEFLSSERIASSSAQYFSMTQRDVKNSFFNSVLRQSLAADPSGILADWVRDREAYCLTLVPLIMPTEPDSIDPDTLELCVQYFLPTSSHFPRLRTIQYYLVAGCSSARAFYIARLPVYNPAVAPSQYEGNDPNVWALLAMLMTNSRAVAHVFRRKLGWDENEAGDKEIEAAFFIRGKGTAMVQAKSHHGSLAQVASIRGKHQLQIMGGSSISWPQL